MFNFYEYKYLTKCNFNNKKLKLFDLHCTYVELWFDRSTVYKKNIFRELKMKQLLAVKKIVIR